MKKYVDYHLQALLSKLVATEPGIVELYLFGSRAYGTGSTRSDRDILVRADPQLNVKPGNLRDFMTDSCPALDLFLCTDSRAVSAANDSFIYAANFDELVRRLDAVKLWARHGGFADFSFPTSGNWTFRTSVQVALHTQAYPMAQWKKWVGNNESRAQTPPDFHRALTSAILLLRRSRKSLISHGG